MEPFEIEAKTLQINFKDQHSFRLLVRNVLKLLLEINLEVENSNQNLIFSKVVKNWTSFWEKKYFHSR